MAHQPLKVKFAGALVEQLGAQLYPSATASVAELISNAWDADARNVWVTIPFDELWRTGEIVVLDDGHGMTREEVQGKYLDLGRKRRLEDHGKTPNGRLVHGRKGIGKLAAFGTAEILDCYTVRHGAAVSFRLGYEKIRKAQAEDDFEVDENLDEQPLLAPDGSRLSSGTRIRLSSLRLKRVISDVRFMKSMSRRFAIDQAEMRVFINSKALRRFDIELEFRYPKDEAPARCEVGADGWGTEILPNGNKVQWWMGFTPKPLEAEYLRGVSILGRGKLLQRPFMFERAQGATGQLGQEYIVGEVRADWLDKGEDIENDLIQTNRDQLQLEDDRVQEILEWGRKRLDWALSCRLQGRRKKVEKVVDDPDIRNLIRDFTATEQRHLSDIARKASKIGDPDPAEVQDFMVEVVNGFKDKAVRELIERVKVEDEGFQSNFWGLVREFSLIDARRNYSIVRARLQTINRLDAAIKAGATEVPDIHKVIKEFPWLLDPRWSLLGDEVDLKAMAESYTETIDEKTRDRLDFLFALQPKPPALPDQILVVEIKRGRKSDETIHRANEQEVYKFHNYVLAVRDHYSRNSSPPTVSGLMIANGYTGKADRVRKDLQGNREVKFEFKTWDSVIENTRLLHTGWLKVTRRASAVDQDGNQWTS